MKVYEPEKIWLIFEKEGITYISHRIFMKITQPEFSESKNHTVEVSSLYKQKYGILYFLPKERSRKLNFFQV